MDQEKFDIFFLIGLALNTMILGGLVWLSKKNTRRWWVRPLNRSRDDNGYCTTIFREMKLTDHEEFFLFTRMWPEQFDILLELITPHLIKKSRRKPLETELRLALTLSYLAHADSVKSKAWQFRIGKSTAYVLIPETCRAIYQALRLIYLPPMNKSKWKKVAKGFYHKWQFPNCLGALDGKHIMIQAPRNSGFLYYNYKKRFSIVLMASCDAWYRFNWVDVGQYGSISDGGVWSYSDLSAALNADEVDLPTPAKLPGCDKITHFSFVADAAFPLTKFIMTPYPGEKLHSSQTVFNYRRSRARRCIENAFGILSSRFQILHRTLAWNPSDIVPIVNATVCLHNFLMDTETALPEEARLYSAPDWRRPVGEQRNIDASRNSRIAVEQRNTLRDYFTSPVGNAQTPWQYSHVFRGSRIIR